MKNKYIEELIDTYYLEEKQNHDQFKGRGIFPYDITIIGNYSHLYENSDVFLISLSEEYHISNMFDEVIDEIERIYKNNQNNDNVVLDTGYYLYYENNFPKLSNNNEKPVEKKYQIYIKLLNDPYNLTYGAVEKDNDIIIQLNTGTIQNDYDLLRETCKHEFLHVREMYSKEQTNILLSKKNRLPEDIDNAFTWDNNVEEFAVNMCILFQPSELRARINAYAEALKLHSYTTFEESLTHTDVITLQDAMSYYIKRITLYLETNNYAANTMDNVKEFLALKENSKKLADTKKLSDYDIYTKLVKIVLLNELLDLIKENKIDYSKENSSESKDKESLSKIIESFLISSFKL